MECSIETVCAGVVCLIWCDGDLMFSVDMQKGGCPSTMETPCCIDARYIHTHVKSLPLRVPIQSVKLHFFS